MGESLYLTDINNANCGHCIFKLNNIVQCMHGINMSQ